MTLPIARDYQARGIEAARAARRAGHRRILLVAPTGSGKSVLATLLAHGASVTHGQRILVIVHSGELVGQWWVHFTQAGIPCGVMMADDYRTDASQPVQIGTAATLNRRDLPPVDLVIIDECSMALAETFARLLDSYPKATIIGLTATPVRLDGRGMRERFDVMIEVAKYSELIDCGAISAPVVYMGRVLPKLDGLKKSHGEYEAGELERRASQAHVIGNVVDTWLKLADGRSTVGFACGVAHSKDLVAQFIDAEVSAAHIDGDTPKSEREDILLRLYFGKLKVVFSVNVLTYGLDIPRVKCAIIARPTLSLAVHMQTGGRIFRPWCPACNGKCERKGELGHGEVSPLILDHAANVDRHGLPHEDREWSLSGSPKRVSQAQAWICAGCYAYVEKMPCPLCGHQVASEPRKIKERDGVLERVDKAIAKERSSDPKRAYFDLQVEHARGKGFKPGFASAKYKEKFGDWPPWAWSQSVKGDFAKDEHWQARVEKRSREREFWQDRQAAALPTQDAQGDPDPGPDEEPRGAFDDL